MDRDHRSFDETEPIERVAAPQPGVPEEAAATPRAVLATSALVVWLAVVVALVAFFMFGRVTVHPDGFERKMRVADVWVEMADELPDVSRPIVLQILYVVALALTVAGAFVSLLIALAARDPEVDRTDKTVSPPEKQPTLESAGRGG